MTEVVFLTSLQGHAVQRVQKVSEALKRRLPDVDVKVLDAAKNKDLMAKHKLKFGPAVLIDGRFEYVGIPRISMLVDRVLQVRNRKENPRGAGDKAAAPPARPATPAPPPAAPAPPPPSGKPA